MKSRSATDRGGRSAVRANPIEPHRAIVELRSFEGGDAGHVRYGGKYFDNPGARLADKLAAGLLGPPVEHARPAPVATGGRAVDDFVSVPVRAEGKDRERLHLMLPSPKAFMVYADGGWRFWSNDRNAMSNALDFCAPEGKTCWLYAVDDRVVWDAARDKRIGRTAQLVDGPMP